MTFPAPPAPLAWARLGRTGRLAVRTSFAVAILALGTYVLHVLFGSRWPGLQAPVTQVILPLSDFGPAAVCFLRAGLVREQRAAWFTIGLAAALCGAAVLYYDVAPPTSTAFFASPANLAWAASPPLIYLGLGLFARVSLPSLRGGLWMDFVIGSLVTAAIGSTIVTAPLLQEAGPGGLGELFEVAWATTDLMAVGFIIVAGAWQGFRLPPAWLLAGLATTLFALADNIYLLQAIHGSYRAGTLLDAGWPAGMLLFAVAAWQRPVRRRQLSGGWAVTTLPLSMAGLAGVLHLYEELVGDALLAEFMTALVFFAVIVRLAMAHRATHRALRGQVRAANTDPITQLGNRRRLLRDLGAALQESGPEARFGLVMYDLDGFKAYNDRFGHPAGDLMLGRLGRALAAAVDGVGKAYRLGGDEFCLLARLDGTHDVEQIAVLGRDALATRGDGFVIGASYGAVELPKEATGVRAALSLADRRMYARKEGRRASASWQVRDALISALSEHDGNLHDHTSSVTELARAVARRLGVDREQVDVVEKAASLHDVGKLAIPTSILEKRGPLDDDEWRLMRRHTIIGERIIGAAPALNSVANIVRASHERVDGKGYPDGLSGERIPLAARIIFVCDSFDAMCSTRSYQEARSADEALAELRRCAGTQFDPDVVEALAAELAASERAQEVVEVPGTENYWRSPRRIASATAAALSETPSFS